MTREEFQDHRINADADKAYKAAFFEALMHYQLVEDLLRDCIIKSCEILDSTSNEIVTYKPSKRHIEDIVQRKGLGSLVDTFESLTRHNDFCARLRKEISNRNRVAHRAAADYVNFDPFEGGAAKCQLKATEIFEFATIASWLYEELCTIHAELLEVHRRECGRTYGDKGTHNNATEPDRE